MPLSKTSIFTKQRDYGATQNAEYSLIQRMDRLQTYLLLLEKEVDLFEVITADLKARTAAYQELTGKNDQRHIVENMAFAFELLGNEKFDHYFKSKAGEGESLLAAWQDAYTFLRDCGYALEPDQLNKTIQIKEFIENTYVAKLHELTDKFRKKLTQTTENLNLLQASMAIKFPNEYQSDYNAIKQDLEKFQKIQQNIIETKQSQTSNFINPVDPYRDMIIFALNILGDNDLQHGKAKFKELFPYSDKFTGKTSIDRALLETYHPFWLLKSNSPEQKQYALEMVQQIISIFETQLKDVINAKQKELIGLEKIIAETYPNNSPKP